MSQEKASHNLSYLVKDNLYDRLYGINRMKFGKMPEAEYIQYAEIMMKLMDMDENPYKGAVDRCRAFSYSASSYEETKETLQLGIDSALCQSWKLFHQPVDIIYLRKIYNEVINPYENHASENITEFYNTGGDIEEFTALASKQAQDSLPGIIAHHMNSKFGIEFDSMKGSDYRFTADKDEVTAKIAARQEALAASEEKEGKVPLNNVSVALENSGKRKELATTASQDTSGDSPYRNQAANLSLLGLDAETAEGILIAATTPRGPLFPLAVSAVAQRNKTHSHVDALGNRAAAGKELY